MKKYQRADVPESTHISVEFFNRNGEEITLVQSFIIQ